MYREAALGSRWHSPFARVQADGLGSSGFRSRYFACTNVDEEVWTTSTRSCKDSPIAEPPPVREAKRRKLAGPNSASSDFGLDNASPTVDAPLRHAERSLKPPRHLGESEAKDFGEYRFRSIHETEIRMNTPDVIYKIWLNLRSHDSFSRKLQALRQSFGNFSAPGTTFELGGGIAAERFAVRNSGATAVCEGSASS
eukprot:s8359_g1.t1